MISESSDPFKHVFVRSPEDDAFIKKCLWKARIHARHKESIGIMLLGDAGTGKSSLLRTLHRQAKEEFSASHRPGPLFSVPSPCTVRAMSRAMRGALGDPAGSDTAPDNLEDMKGLYSLLGVKLFIGDEGHNMGEDKVDLSQSKRKFVKRFMDDLKGVFVFAGTPVLLELLCGDSELERRFKFVERMRVYRPGIESDDLDWRRYMDALDRKTGLAESGLGSPDLAKRIQIAARGRRGIAFDLIDQARDQVLLEGGDRITIQHLSDTFMAFIAKGNPKIKNPFDRNRVL